MPRDQHAPADDDLDDLRAVDPLTRYRQLQARLRHRFAPFTREVCPTCPTPCCRRPTAVTPLDVVLAEELGHRLPAGVEGAADYADTHLGLIPVPTLTSEGGPCLFLGQRGCSFPPDLMPCGCVAYICPYMETWYTPTQLDELRAAIAQLEAAYRELRAALLDGA